MKKRILEVIVVCLFCILEAGAAYFFVPSEGLGVQQSAGTD